MGKVQSKVETRFHNQMRQTVESLKEQTASKIKLLRRDEAIRHHVKNMIQGDWLEYNAVWAYPTIALVTLVLVGLWIYAISCRVDKPEHRSKRLALIQLPMGVAVSIIAIVSIFMVPAMTTNSMRRIVGDLWNAIQVGQVPLQPDSLHLLDLFSLKSYPKLNAIRVLLIIIAIMVAVVFMMPITQDVSVPKKGQKT